ncbi:MAG: sulfurtransferase-like selenium metabolism protein YedF [Bacteroides sp.]|nr:sulfurtransferase-like selenium metabolism protein YedF [Bacteroides sp.]
MPTVDVRGLSCPAPLIKTKQAISQAAAGTPIQVVGDGAIPLGNLKNYLSELGIAFKEMQVDNQEWILSFVVGSEVEKSAADRSQAEAFCSTAPAPAPAQTPSGSYVVAVSSLCMGKGDERLGSLLIKAFLNVLPELDSLPQAICFYNEGVKLTCADSPVLESLKVLQEKGVSLVVCGTCVEFYGLQEKVAVGSISNMYHIATLLSQSFKVVYP